MALTQRVKDLILSIMGGDEQNRDEVVNGLQSNIKSDGSVAFAANQSMGSHRLTSLADPSSAQDAATKNYVDSAASSLPTDEIYLRGGNGSGSTNTVIRRFTTTTLNRGSSMTYADSATAGASITINTTGLYSITYIDQSDNTPTGLGLSVNSTHLTTDISDATNDSYRVALSVVDLNPRTINIEMNLAANDVVRPHNGSPLAGATNITAFRIVRTR